MPNSIPRLILLCCLGLLFHALAMGQRGGETVYTFLRLSPSSRITAMGGTQISVRDADPAFAVLNPASLNVAMDKSLTFQYHFLFDGISEGYVGFARHFEKQGITGHAGIQFIQYGEFREADAYGNLQGTFKANEIALTVGAAKQLGERISAGTNLRFVQSRLESYNSSGLMLDIGGTYSVAEQGITLGLAVRNVGVQLTSYDDITEDMPIDIQLGLSKRLAHLPFRLSITAHSLNTWDLLYDSPLTGPETTVIGEAPKEKSQFSQDLDNAVRHLIFGGEFLLGKQENFHLRLGYNHQRRKELSVSSLRSFAGFSFGLGIRIKQFAIDYGLATYHIAGSTNHIGISTNLERFKKSNGILD